MKTTSTTTTPTTQHGPGEYKAEAVFQRIEDLPQPKVIQEDRNASHRPCPSCGKAARREHEYQRQLHEVGDLISGRPVELHLTYSQHHCKVCNRYFMTDLSDVAPPGSQYTHRVIALAVRVVVEDGLAYRNASWHLWRDHRVFVPFATIQNGVEARGKKSKRRLGKRLSGMGAF
jgi:transposase